MSEGVDATRVQRAELEPEIAALRDAAKDTAGPPLTEMSPEAARERVRAGNGLCSGGPTEVRVTDSAATTAGDPPVPVRIYEHGQAPLTLVYAHGGGWVTGDLDYSDELCRYVATTGVRVVSVDYRLAPDHPFPAAFDDVRTAASWAAGQYGRIALGGDSAGGNLAAAAALSLSDGSEGERPAFLVLVYPVLDASMGQPSYVENAQAFPIGAADMEWFLDHYVAPLDRRDPRVAPLRADSFEKLPPTHVLAAGHDPLRDEALAFADGLEAIGVPVSVDLQPSLCHGFLRFTAVSRVASAARDQLVARIAELAATVGAGPVR